MTKDVKIDENNFYDKTTTNLQNLANKDWSSNNNFKFANLIKFKDKLDSFYSQKENQLLFDKGKNILESIDKENMVINIANDGDSTFSLVLDKINFLNDKSGFFTPTKHSQ